MNKKWRNPNQDFDALVWKPKNRLLRRLTARYVDYIEVAGYFFAVLLVGSVIGTWTIKKKEWVDADKNQQLTPVKVEAEARFSGTVDTTLADAGQSVRAGQVVMVITDSAGERREIVSPAAGMIYPPFKKKQSSYTREQLDSMSGLPLDPAMRSMVDSLLNEEFALVEKGMKVKKGTVLFQVVDFDEYVLDVKLDKALDSLSIGDTAEIEAVSYAARGMKKAPSGIVNLSRPGRPLSGRVVAPFADEIRGYLDKQLKGTSVTAKEQAVYPFSSIGGLEIIVRFDGISEGGKHRCAPVHCLSEPLYGHIESGEMSLEAEALLVDLPDSIGRHVRAWADSLAAARPVELDGKRYVSGGKASVKLKMSVRGTVALKDFVPYDRKNRKNRPAAEYFEKNRSAKCRIRIRRAPDHVKRLARELFELSPPRYIVVKVRVNTHSTTWGHKLIQK